MRDDSVTFVIGGCDHPLIEFTDRKPSASPISIITDGSTTRGTRYTIDTRDSKIHVQETNVRSLSHRDEGRTPLGKEYLGTVNTRRWAVLKRAQTF